MPVSTETQQYVPKVPHPEPQFVKANGIEIAYETFGDSSNPAFVLIMGLGTQMIAWPDEFCQSIADAGYYVIRYDNRDVGLSTHIDGPPPPLWPVVFRRIPPAYTISDMARDCVGLMDALGIDKAHVVGVSLGGFIAQTVALKFPERLISLTLMMTSTGSVRVGMARPHVSRRLLKRREILTREDAVNAAFETFEVIGSPGYALDEPYMRHLVDRSMERAQNPYGYMRQLQAALRQPNRTKFLKRIKVPTLVMHGLADPLVRVSGGFALAKAIPNAKFVGFAGHGHDLPRELWPDMIREILANADRAPARR